MEIGEGEDIVIATELSAEATKLPRSIAGILNDSGNVLGLMPHPERAAEREVGEAEHGAGDGEEGRASLAVGGRA